MIRMYLSKNHSKLNSREFYAEYVSLVPYLCVNPIHSGIEILNPYAKTLMDSGAFQDREREKRLTPEQALDRQLRLETKLGMESQRIVAYDYIGNVPRTLEGNRYLSSKRDELGGRQLVMVVQGDLFHGNRIPKTDSYLHCLRHTLELSTGQDCIGLGGFALAGAQGVYRQGLYDVFRRSAPIIAQQGVRDVHLFGVGTFSVLEAIVEMNRELGTNLRISADTSSYEVNSTIAGKLLDRDSRKWTSPYSKNMKHSAGRVWVLPRVRWETVENVAATVAPDHGYYHPCDLALTNMSTALDILSDIGRGRG